MSSVFEINVQDAVVTVRYDELPATPAQADEIQRTVADTMRAVTVDGHGEVLLRWVQVPS